MPGGKQGQQLDALDVPLIATWWPREYWWLPKNYRYALLRYAYRVILAEVTEGEIGTEEFAQEISIRLKRRGPPVQFVKKTIKGVVTIQFQDVESRHRFREIEKWAFRKLTDPYRCKKRKERVVSFSDPRWKPDPKAPESSPYARSLQRYPQEFRHHGPQKVIENPEEREKAGLLDITRHILNEFPEPVVLAALGHLTQIEAARQLRVRNTTAVALIHQAKRAIQELESSE
jgi:hypothetical protein